MLTKLMFTMDGEGELIYKTVQWNDSLIESAGKQPAGPLFDITCSKDAVSKLHLPHCEKKSGKQAQCCSGLKIIKRIISFLAFVKTYKMLDVTGIRFP